jgi:hypothetical protein
MLVEGVPPLNELVFFKLQLVMFFEEESGQEPQTAATEVGATPPEGTSAEVVTCTAPLQLPVVLSEAEQEEVATQNAARHDWIAQEGRQQREVHGL